MNREGYPTEKEALKALERYKLMEKRKQIQWARKGTPWGPVRYTILVQI